MIRAAVFYLVCGVVYAIACLFIPMSLWAQWTNPAVKMDLKVRRNNK